MRRFLDEKGTFEIIVPINWKYSLQKEKVHTFQDYEIWKSDTFQLSITNLETTEDENNFNFFLDSFGKIEKGKIDCYKLPDNIGKEFSIKSWVKRFDKKVALFTLTFSNKTDKTLDGLSIKKKVKIVKSIIESFKLIEESKSETELKYYRFKMFLHGIGATMDMLNNAVEHGAFIEATCIIANQIDALLRTGIILKQQILNRNSEIESEWIYQGIKDKKKSEKDIYRKSKELGIIDDVAHNELQSLYDDRNRVIHRFIISEITLAEVEEIAYSYYKQQEKINQIIYALESEQIKLNIGMTRTGTGTPEENNEILAQIKDKLAKLNYFDRKNKII